MTNSEEQAFLDAINANPEDDTPRLVFADWLDERNQGDDAARAALIRAQCRAEILPPESKERKKLEREAKAILKEHGDRWAKPLADTKLVKGWTFRRGFLDGVTMSATRFASNAKKIFDAAPTVRTAHFPEASNEVGRLAGCEYLSRLAAVNLSDLCHCGFCPIHNDLRALFNSKHTGSLKELHVAGDRMDAAGAKRLAKSKALARLTSLDVSMNPFGDTGLIAISQSRHLKHLVTLNLSATGFAGNGLEELGKSKHLPALRNLIMRNCGLRSDVLKTFVASPLFAQLTLLDLSNNQFGDAGARALAAAPEGAKLETLIAKGCKLTEKGKALLKKRFGKEVKV